MSEKDRAAAWMLGLLVFSYALVSAGRRVFGVTADSIRYDLGLTNTQTLLASDVTILALAVSGLGVGYLTRITSRKIITLVGLLVASLATLAVAWAQDFTEIFVARLMMGVGTALLLSAVLTMGIRYFSRQRFAVIALVFFATGLGSIVGMNVGGIMEDDVGWRQTHITFGLLGLTLAVLIMLYVKQWFSQSRVTNPFFYNEFTHPAPSPSMWSRRPMLLGAMTVLSGVAVFCFHSIYISHLREIGGVTWKGGQVTLSLYAFGNLFAFYGISLFKRYGARTVLVSLFFMTGILSFIMLLDIWKTNAIYVFFSVFLGISLGGMATVALMAEMIKSVVAEEAPPVMGWFTACLYGPGFLLNILSEGLLEAMGWRGVGLVLITGSLIGASLLAMLLPKSSEIVRSI